MPAPKLQAVVELSLPGRLRAGESASSSAVRDDVLSLFDECAPALRRYLASFGLRADAADDVLQDVFVSLFRHLRLGRPRTNLQGWLFRVAHNLALQQRQKTARRHATESDWDATLAERLVDPTADPEQRLVDVGRGRRLHSVLRALPERDRQCLYLRAEGLSYRDIANTLGIALGSVAKSLTRAFERLACADLR